MVAVTTYHDGTIVNAFLSGEWRGREYKFPPTKVDEISHAFVIDTYSVLALKNALGEISYDFKS